MADELIHSPGGWLLNRRTSRPAEFRIKTHYDPHVLGSSPFGGIEGELFSIMPGSMVTSASITTTNGVARVSLPASGTTSVFVSFELPEWWLAGRINILMDYVNDHSGTGNARLQFVLREADIFSTIAGGDTPIDATVTWPSGSAGQLLTGVIAGLDPGLLPWTGNNPFIPTPGSGGSVYGLTITRLGDDGADTLAGPLGVIAIPVGRISRTEST